jgi:hypothetical protein
VVGPEEDSKDCLMADMQILNRLTAGSLLYLDKHLRQVFDDSVREISRVMNHADEGH